MAVVKLLFYLLLLYFVIKTTRNLIRAALTDGRPEPPRMAPPGRDGRTGPGSQAGAHAAWNGPAPARRPVHVDIEDAKWKDL